MQGVSSISLTNVSCLADCGARSIYSAFVQYQAAFSEVTLRARSRFENQDWSGMQSDASERLDLYTQIVQSNVQDLCENILGDSCKDRSIWIAMRSAYSELVGHRDDLDLAETFFNSISRKIFTTVGVDTSIEYVDTDFEYFPKDHHPQLFTRYPGEADLTTTLKNILEYYSFQYEDVTRDANIVAKEIQSELSRTGEDARIDHIDILNSIFYRGKGAYIVGRIWRNNKI